MKNPPPARPRFTCRVVRGWRSIFGDTSAGEPRGPGAAHVARCADCRRFFGACDELGLALKRDAVREWRAPPTGLEQDILRAVQRSAAEAVPARRGARLVWLSLAGAGACALLAAVILRPPFRAVPAIAPTVAPAPVASVRVSPQQLWNSLKPSTDAMLAGDPLQHEVDAVVADARSAVRFLERNFVPESPGRSG